MEHSVGESTLLGCYHVSQQNTFTRVLTPPMLDDVLLRARRLGGYGDGGSERTLPPG